MWRTPNLAVCSFERPSTTTPTNEKLVVYLFAKQTAATSVLGSYSGDCAPVFAIASPSPRQVVGAPFWTQDSS